MIQFLASLLLKPALLWVNRTAFAFKETFRIRGPLVLAVNLVCGITLSLLLLLGLVNGIIRQQERDVEKSPSAVEVTIAASRTSQSLSPALIRDLESRPGIERVIEDITKVVDFKGTSERTGVTVRCTKPGDPLLKFCHADVLQSGQKAIVINTALADALGVKYRTENNRCHVERRQQVVMSVTRQEGTATARATLKLNVAEVAAIGDKTPLGFLHRDLLNHIEDYQMGRRVETLNWPGFARSAPVTYTEYVMFTKEPTTTLDLMKLKANGLTTRRLDPNKPDDQSLRTLAGCVRPESLNVYRLSAESSGSSGPKLLTRRPEEIESVTDVDDIVIGWSSPLEIRGPHATLIGLTVNKRWLKTFFVDPVLPFTSDKNELVMKPFDGSMAPASHWDLPLKGSTLTLSVMPTSSPVHQASVSLPSIATAPTVAPSTPPLAGMIRTLQQTAPQIFGTPGGGATHPAVSTTPASTVTALKPVWPTPSFKAVVPAALLSHLHAVERGTVEFDPSSSMFVKAARANAYFQARVIATDIHAVPAVDDLLTKEGFATQSQRIRVQELQGYARTLRLLVYVVGGILAYAGLSTLMTTFWQETNRKARFMADLRLLGARPLTIVYIVLVRGLMIGAVAGGVTIALAGTAARLLTRYVAECTIVPEHVFLVALAALVAAGVGSLLPALRASLIEPSEALREGASH